MNNLYNAKLSYKGEGSFTFTLPKYGDLTIYENKDVYIKGLSVQGVELLRQLRSLNLIHQLNAKPDGCYRVIDLNDYGIPTIAQFKPQVQTSTTLADLKAGLVKTTGPIMEEPLVKTELEQKEVAEVVIDTNIEEVKEEPKKKVSISSKKGSKGKTTKKK